MKPTQRSPAAARRLLDGYYFITDDRLTRQGIQRIQWMFLRSGVGWSRYRRKDGPSRLLTKRPVSCAALTHGPCFRVIVY